MTTRLTRTPARTLARTFAALFVGAGGVGVIGATACARPQRAGIPTGSVTARARDSAAAWNAPYRDASPHRADDVRVGPGVRLHYLDWGGTGPTLVLLTGFGLSAHVYDDLAPQLTDRFRVVALTRRGHGESDHPAGGYGLATALDDIRQLLDTLHTGRAVLVGHSHGGWEASRFAARYPERTLAVVYLDGTITPAGYGAMTAHEPVRRPPPDFSSPAAARAWYTRYFYGTWTPALEADLRHHTVDGSKWDESDRDWATQPAEYAAVRAPALALYEIATMESRYFWLPAADTAQRAQATAYLRDWFNPWQRRGVDDFTAHIRDGRAIRMPGGHYFFVTHQGPVVAELRRFLLSATVRERASTGTN